MIKLTMNNLPLPLHTSLLILLISFLLFIIPSQSEEPVFVSCENSVPNATAEISNTIGNLLPTFIKLTEQNGSTMANCTSKNGTKIFALAQCRGDVTNAACSTCINNAIEVVRSTKYCLRQSGASIWYNFCFLRYSTRNFYGEVDGGVVFKNLANVTKFSREFNGALTTLMNEITLEALKSGKGFGKGKLKVPRYKNNVTLYGLLQCNKDLLDPAYMSCGKCLNWATNYIFTPGNACEKRLGCRILLESCFLEYELYNFFYNGSSSSSSVGNYESVSVVVHVDKN